jgi:hypothetical protein
MRGYRLVAVLVALFATRALAAAPHASPTDYPPAAQALAGPTGVLEHLADAYRSMLVAGVDAVLSADYRFHAVGENGENLLSFADGSPREYEMRSVRGMLEGVTRDGKVVMAKADSVGMSFDGISADMDPEHPDSTQQYLVLTVTRAQWGIRLANGNHMWNKPSLHVFHVVRGDAAVLAPGQTADPERWYIRRWLEDVSGLRTALGEKKGDCGEHDPSTEPVVAAGMALTPARPQALGIRALTNPACSALRVSCDLPTDEAAKVEVYDVSGRLVNSKPLPAKSAGNVTVDAGAGAHLIPGVYWVRLNQTKQRPSTRMVVVAR